MNKLCKNLLILMIILLSARFILGLVGFIFYIIAKLFLMIFSLLMFSLTLILPIIILIGIGILITKHPKFDNEIQKHIDKTRDQIKF